MLNASFSRRFLSWPVLTRHQERTVGIHGQAPEGVGGFRVSFQRRQNHVKRHVGGNLIYGSGKQVQALFAGNGNAPGCFDP